MLIDVSAYNELYSYQPSHNVEMKSVEKNTVSDDYEHQHNQIEPIEND